MRVRRMWHVILTPTVADPWAAPSRVGANEMTLPVIRRRVQGVPLQHENNEARGVARHGPGVAKPESARGMSTFEQVILTNSAIIVASALAAYLVTHISYAPYNYLIDTLFVVAATITGVAVNAFLLRRAFRPLFGILTTIEAVQSGKTHQRVASDVPAADIAQLALAFNAMLDALEASRRAGLRDVAQAQEDERRRLALELHDATGQEITALILRLELVRQELEDVDVTTAVIRSQLDETAALAQRTLRGVQTLAQQLRPTVLDDLGLSAALRWLASEMQAGTPMTITVYAAEAPAPCTAQAALAETMLFRVAQEALANAVRHSGAGQIELRLEYTQRALTLVIRDDGCGFTLAARAGGTGLGSMRERMTLVGGRCIIHTTPGVGTTISATAPFSAPGGQRS